MRLKLKWITTTAALIALPALAHVAETAPPVDDDFLEFLGSADSDDPEFNEYIASGDVDKALEKGQVKPQDGHATQPAADEPPASKVKSDAT